MNKKPIQFGTQRSLKVLRAIANSSRLSILLMLLQREQHVGELCRQIDVSQSALSQHLALLREEGLVVTRRQAQMIFYRLADDQIKGFLYTIQSLYGSQD